MPADFDVSAHLEGESIQGAPIEDLLLRCHVLGLVPRELDNRLLMRHVAVQASIYHALLTYRPKPTSVFATLFHSQDETQDEIIDGWKSLLGEELRTAEVNGTHYSMVAEPHARALAEAISHALTNSEQRALDVPVTTG